MSMDNEVFAHELMEQTLWWRYAVTEESDGVKLSASFQRFFKHAVHTLEDLTGPYTTPIIGIKIREILESPERDIRFTTAYDTLYGKRTFQHQLRVYHEDSLTYVWATCIDVSERVALEREIVDAQGRMSVSQLFERQTLLEEQNRFISESYQKQSHFLAMLSHELRSPLLGISSLVERLRKKEKDKDVLTALKTIHMTAEQSTFLVNDILTYSQTEYDEVTLHPTQFSLRETLENVKQLTKSIAADKGLIISLIYIGEQDTVVGDSVRLSQILINLIVNSIKFTEYGGVTIEVAQKNDVHFFFKVTDSGEGIADEQLEHIFEPFAQLESLGSAQNIGSGLGLLVVRKLVSLMGGEIQVRSALGVGTSFSFELVFAVNHTSRSNSDVKPITHSVSQLEELADASLERQEQESAKQVEVSGSTPMKILVADDSKINRMVLSGYLEDLDGTVIEAKNGKQAWELFQQNDFEYVFLDIQMPFMDGIEVSRRIQQCKLDFCECTKSLKGVFAITAGGDESEFVPAGETLESIGFDHWFVKPVTKSQVIGLLQNDLPRPSAEKKSGKVESKTLEKESPSPVLDKKPKGFHLEAGQELGQEIVWDSIEVIPEQFHSLLEPFVSELEIGIHDIQKMAQKEDWQAVSAKAHYLKGNCMLFQLNALVELFREVEVVSKGTKNQGIKWLEVKLIAEKLTLGLKYLEKSRMISHNAT